MPPKIDSVGKNKKGKDNGTKIRQLIFLGAALFSNVNTIPRNIITMIFFAIFGSYI